MGRVNYFFAFFILLSGHLVIGAEKGNHHKQTSGAMEMRELSSDQIAQKAGEAFMNAKGLTTEQKKKLMDIYMTTYAEAISIKQEIKQSKMKLFELIVIKDIDSKEIQALKDKIYEADQRRLLVMFKALAGVQKVVGTGKDKKEIYEHLRDYERPHNKQYSMNQGD